MTLWLSCKGDPASEHEAFATIQEMKTWAQRTLAPAGVPRELQAGSTDFGAPRGGSVTETVGPRTDAAAADR